MYKVLIVDDESAIRKGLVSCIDWASIGCEVVKCASNGKQALEFIEKSQPDIVISDIHMDEMSGIDILKVASEKYPNIKFILLTGIYEFNNAYSAIKYNVVDLVLKPTTSSKIMQVVKQAIKKIEDEKEHKYLRLKLQEQAEQNLLLKQTFLLLSIINGADYGENINKMLNRVKINISGFCIINILVHGIDQNCLQDTNILNAEELLSNYIDMVFEGMEYYFVSKNHHGVYIIINKLFLKEESSKQKIRERCLELSKIVDSLTDFYVAIGISNLHADPVEMNRAAIESETASEFALYSDNNSIIEYADLPQLSTPVIRNIKTYIDNLYEAVEMLNLQYAIKIIKDLKHYCIKNKLPLIEVKNVGILILNICIKQLWAYNFLEEHIFSLRNNFCTIIFDCKNIEVLFKNLCDITESTIKDLTSKTKYQGDLIDDIENYINENYNKELSLESIAATFYISAGHLSRLFKSKKKINLSTYIQSVRIEKAKDLIATTDMHSYEIAEMVGINDPVYFSKLFKKFTGCSVRHFKSSINK